MRWKVGTLYQMQQTGVDETRKPVCEPVSMGIAHFRVLPWRPVHHDVAGNEFDKVTRTWFTKIPSDELAGAVKVSLDGYMWEIDHVADFGDGSAVTAWRAK